eukprot:6458724-Amphidinium_carterae.2
MCDSFITCSRKSRCQHVRKGLPEVRVQNVRGSTSGFELFDAGCNLGGREEGFVDVIVSLMCAWKVKVVERVDGRFGGSEVALPMSHP